MPTARPAYSRLKQTALGVASGMFLMVAAGIFTAQPVAAEPYGAGAYNNCQYQHCESVVPTEVTLPSGLEVAVNLADGQTIPLGGYRITVTPLNGHGSSFKQADFYVDGQLVQGAVLPDGTGTATWQWKPLHEGTAAVKVVVTDTNGTVTARQFTVTVRAAVPASGANASPQGQGDSSSRTTVSGKPQSKSARIVHVVSEGVKQVIRALPRPVVYSFPYLLLALLGGNLLVLLLQVKRELSAYRHMQARLAQLRAVDESKKTFMELVSHYFRTPLTVLSGGIDMLEPKEIPASAIVQLKAVNVRLHSGVEQLISQAVAGQQAYRPVLPQYHKAWRYAGLCAPVLLIGMITFGFTYVTSRAGDFTVTQLNVGIQIVMYALLALACYQVFRRVQLHKNETALARQVFEQQEIALQARDGLIQSAASAISNDVHELDRLLAALPATKSIGFIRNGQQRFHELAAKFVLVASLRGGHSTKPPVAVVLGDLLALCRERLQPLLDKKRLKLDVSPDATPFTVHDKELVAYVLGGILDNAIAFSPEAGTITVGLDVTPPGVQVTVTDQGPGISADKQAELFQPFSKVNGALTFDHEGMGLGLYTDKLIMEYVGGEIRLESEPGRTAVMLGLPV